MRTTYRCRPFAHDAYHDIIDMQQTIAHRNNRKLFHNLLLIPIIIDASANGHEFDSQSLIVHTLDNRGRQNYTITSVATHKFSVLRQSLSVECY